MKSEFASANLTAGQLNDIVKKLGGYEGALRFLRYETLVAKLSRNWRIQDDIIYFSVISDGATGKEWISRLENKGFLVSDCVKDVLNSKNFRPSSGVTTEIAVIKGKYWNNVNRTTKAILAKASEFQFSVPNIEMACLIRESILDKEISAMGFWWIVVMHEPVYNADGAPLLFVASYDEECSCLDTSCGCIDHRWNVGGGFAFVLSQTFSS